MPPRPRSPRANSYGGPHPARAALLVTPLSKGPAGAGTASIDLEIAFAEGAAMHGAPPERHWVAETRRALVWGLGLPLAGLLGMVVTPWAALVFAAYPVQVLRLWRRLGGERAFFVTLGKLPEATGVVQFWLNRLTHRRAALIEYK